MSSRSLSLLSWLLDRVLAFVFAYICSKAFGKQLGTNNPTKLAIDTAAQSAK
jgi:hypothetical protein